VTNRFLAFDLGAESGRAILGQLYRGALTITELYRFPNEPVRYAGELHWDVSRLWLEMQRGLDRIAGPALDSIGVDTWGCDYALLGERGNLLENPFSYRDARTDGVMQAVNDRVGADAVYGATGIQFLPFNTLYQLYAACRSTPRLIAAAQALATIPDLLNFWLSGHLQSEYSNATTTAMVDSRSRSWATELLESLELPTRLLLPLIEPGSVVGGVTVDACAARTGTPVIAPACHDTASAVAAVEAGGTSAFISSGTWSLLGTELSAPIVSDRTRELNFTNEGGVCGTTRLLKNIGGLWLLQACRRTWARAGQIYGYDELLTAASQQSPGFTSLFDPDHRGFLHPDDMVSAIAGYCRQTGQAEPGSPAGYARAILESLAFKYRRVLESLEEVTGTHFEEIRIVGGGSRNRLLNQFTANATGRTVVSGPVEATALGNIAMQMLATGAVSSLREARAVIDRSFPVDRFEPSEADRWDAHYRRFHEYVELTCV
jgi:rhamnulokinase